MNAQSRTVIYTISAVLLLAGAILYNFQVDIAPYLFAIGAAGITVCYLTVSVKHMGLRQKRLHKYNIMAGLLTVFASALMFSDRKEWLICLTVAAIFQLYTAFVTPKEE
jgi:hypothetical protein